MDKSLIHSDRRSKQYEEGVDEFIRRCLQNPHVDSNLIHCPCCKCINLKKGPIKSIREHLYFHGFSQNYVNWIWDGEPAENDRVNLSVNQEPIDNYYDNFETANMCDAANENYTENPEAFIKFLEEAEKPLYKGCKRYTKLSALIKLYNTKARHGMSDALFSDLLLDFGDMLPDNHNLPSSMYDAKKTLSCLALSHERIHACSNDCILFRKQYKDCISCPKCGLSRWKLTKNKVEKKGVRHCLDVMHIEKNVFESLINTLMNVKGKTKDNVAARLDMVQMGIRPELAPKIEQKRTYLPPAACSFTKKEKLQVCKSLIDIKVPEGFSSNMKNLVCIGELKLIGLKSHDCHVLMQHFLPIVIRDALPKHVRYAIIRLCFFFKDICCKVIDIAKLDKLQSDLVITLCLLEQYFPPSFFDVMLHLTVHLVREVRLCGPVHFRWMYPFERCMKVLKSYVGSRKHPEGCIVQRYSAEEAVEFCSEYLKGLDPVGIPQTNIPGFSVCNAPIVVPLVDLQQAHLTVLENTEEVSPYIIEHKTFLKSIFPKKAKDERWIQDAHKKRFIEWFRAKVAAEIDSCSCETTSTMTWLAHGPRVQVLKYNSYVINGNLYQTKARDDEKVCQNSGVSLVANTMLVCSAKDKNPLLADVSFYGVIEEIWELDYHKFQVPLFKCAWVANDKGVINNDECGFTMVNLNKREHKNDEFVLASQVSQVFYIDDPLKKGWSIVLSVPNRCYEGDDDSWTSIPESRPIDNIDTHCIPIHERYFRSENDGVWVTNKKK